MSGSSAPWSSSARRLLCVLVGLALLGVACGARARSPGKPERRPAAETRKRPGPTGAARSPAGAPIGAGSVDRVKKLWEAAAGSSGRAVAISSKLGRVAFASRDAVQLYDLWTGKALGPVKSCRDVVHTGLGFHAGTLVTVCEKTVVVTDAKKLSPLAPPAVHAARVSAATMVGSRLVLGHRDGVVRVYDLTGAATVEIPVAGPPIDVKSLALTRDGSRLAVAWVQGSIWWWDVAQPSDAHDLVRHEAESDALAFSPDGALLAEEGSKHLTTLWALAPSPAVRQEVRNGAWVKRIVFTRDGKWLARAGSEGVELAEIGGPKRVALDTRSPAEDVAFDEHGATLAAVDRDGRLTVWGVR